jgi:hypothetical protein
MTDRIGACVIFFAATTSCVGDNNNSIAVTTPNALGVKSIIVDQNRTSGDRTFELRGLDAYGDQVAIVRLHTGEVVDLAPYGSYGSEVTTSVNGQDTQYVTRETKTFMLFPDPGSALEQFVQVDPVTSTLAGEANIIVKLESRPAGEAPYAGTVFAKSCSVDPGFLLTTPLAEACCLHGIEDPNANIRTTFYDAATNMIVNRLANPNGQWCVGSDGSSACDGRACYFGPDGFARGTFSAPPTPYWYMDYEAPTLCIVTQSNTNVGLGMPNVTGTFPRGQGCPGADPGDGDWDY